MFLPLLLLIRPAVQRCCVLTVLRCLAVLALAIEYLVVYSGIHRRVVIPGNFLGSLRFELPEV